MSGAKVIEIICSDPVEHRRRVESRQSDIPGLPLPSWQAVLDREYEPWDRSHVVADTATVSVDEALATLTASLAGK